MRKKTPNNPEKSSLGLAFYQPDIPQNIGAAMRLCACLDVAMHVIEPTAFLWKDEAFRRSGMDYRDHVKLEKHTGWDRFQANTHAHRLVLLTTKTDHSYLDFSFQSGDILLLGSESAGVPEDLHQSLTHKVTIPMQSGFRSLNVVNSAAMVVGEALRQINAG